MKQPIEQAPPEFSKRYSSIMRGDEVLDTPEKIKSFWQLSIDQGWKTYEMREHIAKLVEAADLTSPVVKNFWYGPNPKHGASIFAIHDLFRSYKVMYPSPIEGKTDEQYLDETWHAIEYEVKYFRPDQYLVRSTPFTHY
jgi:hypothetical protein